MLTFYKFIARFSSFFAYPQKYLIFLLKIFFFIIFCFSTLFSIIIKIPFNIIVLSCSQEMCNKIQNIEIYVCTTRERERIEWIIKESKKGQKICLKHHKICFRRIYVCIFPFLYSILVSTTDGFSLPLLLTPQSSRTYYKLKAYVKALSASCAFDLFNIEKLENKSKRHISM